MALYGSRVSHRLYPCLCSHAGPAQLYHDVQLYLDVQAGAPFPGMLSSLVSAQGALFRSKIINNLGNLQMHHS